VNSWSIHCRAGWILPVGIEGLPAALAKQAKGPEQPFPKSKLGKQKRDTPKQSKRYQDKSRLSTVETQKNKWIERKYDISILGNIYIFTA
jgi:hypothetical protein